METSETEPTEQQTLPSTDLATDQFIDAAVKENSHESSEKNDAVKEPETVPDRLRGLQDVTLKFLANASNETLGACAVGLCASTYLVLGRVGLVLIGAVGGVVLHATWENSTNSNDNGGTGKAESARKRKELGLEVAKRALDWRDARRDGEHLDQDNTEKIETSVLKEALDYSAFQPATATALTGFTDAVVRDYVKWWYGPILPKDEIFPAACRQTLTSFLISFSNHVSKKRTADPFLDFMANSTSILIVFLNELSAAIRASPNQSVDDAIATYLEYSPDSSLANVLSPDQQQKKLNLVADDILESFLESKTYNCAPAKLFLREVLANLILQATVNNCSKAEWINGWIVYLLEDGEPELLNAIDASVEPLGKGLKQTDQVAGDNAVEDKKHQRRISRAEEAMQEAMREAQRINKMIAEDEARRKRGESLQDNEDTTSTTTTDIEIRTPASSDSERVNRKESMFENDMVFDSEGNAIPSGASSPAKLASPVAERQQAFTNFDQLAPRAVPTALRTELSSVTADPEPATTDVEPESVPPPPAETMIAIPLTLHNASITLLDMGTGNDKAVLKSKPGDEMLVQIEPASSRFSGWMATRKYADFDPLHETLRRIAVISGVPEFVEEHTQVPEWKGKSRAQLIADLEKYLKHAVKYERLAESEAMKKFLEKDTGLSKIPAQNKNVLLQGAAALDNVGKGFVNVLGQGGKGIAGGGKAVLGGVQGVFGSIGPKKTAARSNSDISRLNTTNISNSRFSQDIVRSSTEPSESRPSLVSRPSGSSFEHVGSSSVSQASVSQEQLNLPPPPSEIPDEYPGFNPTTSPKHITTSPLEAESTTQAKESMDSTDSKELKSSRPSTPTLPSKASATTSPIVAQQTPLTAIPDHTSSPTVSTQPKPLRQPSRSNAKRSQPLTEEETRMTVDLMFAIITSTYSLSSAWTIRLSLLSAAKSFLLRPNNPQLESIRTLIQDSMIGANTSDAAIAAHINKLRENTLPTEEELAQWPAELEPKEKEDLRNKARKLLIERGMPQALTSVMGQAASSEAMAKVFDCLQIERVARGLIFALMLQSIRAVMQ